MKAAVVVAHPDDEIIWCGGLVLRHPDWDWTVLALCRADDADRAPKFRRVCELVDARGILSDLDDGNPLGAVDFERDLAPRIEPHLGGSQWDLLLTHGSNGEYGHPRHIQTQEAIHLLAESSRLRTRRLWTFAYEAVNPIGNCRPASWANWTVELSRGELAEKRRLVRDVYGHPERGFEVRSCISPEAFARVRPDTAEELAL
jgi:LmbE family N-acetylglucosaminyl deacetylase